MERNNYMHFVYILQSRKDQELYIGYTTDIRTRLAAHNAGETQSTKFRRPFDLIYYEAYVDKLDALGRERFLKSGSGHRFIRKQLKHFFDRRSLAATHPTSGTIFYGQETEHPRQNVG